MHNHTNCWNCGKFPEEIHFCSSCNSLQPPATNYFDFFGVEHKLNLDLRELERRFYTLSRRLHPDVYFRRPAKEQQYSLDATAILNDGYRTLRDPISRAEYLLRENGFDIGEQKSNHVPPELLEEVFELNMALEESDRSQLEDFREKFLKMRHDVDSELQQKFQEYDRKGDRGVLQQVRGILNRRSYIRNLVNQVETALQPV